ncbi:MAG TPA: DUF1223 domain-containing protein [Terriglobales bacterium]|nr:DUF1223 domain-containing protein [Terriglobales bacterium]
MKKLVRLLVFFGAVALSSFAFAQTPVVVELFTSEGCSSCPPADALLMKLSQQHAGAGTELVLLGEHVDYWNYIGWTDRFSSAQFSQRQSDYGRALHSSVYTPQMVIDGSTEFVGSDASVARRNIAAAAKDPKPAQVTLRWDSNNRLHISVQSSSTEHSTVLLAVTEDGLSTSVEAGENGGRTLNHAAVVRQLREIGAVDKGAFEANVNATPHAGWDAAELKIVVLVQDPASMKILGAAMVPYAH